MKKVIHYEAFDGKQFETEEQCINYELETTTIKMFTYQGEQVTEVDEAYFVYLGTCNNPQGNIFVSLAEHQGSSCNGIEYNEYYPECGWFYWNEYEDKYCYLNEDLSEGIYKIYPRIQEAKAEAFSR